MEKKKREKIYADIFIKYHNKNESADFTVKEMLESSEDVIFEDSKGTQIKAQLTEATNFEGSYCKNKVKIFDDLITKNVLASISKKARMNYSNVRELILIIHINSVNLKESGIIDASEMTKMQGAANQTLFPKVYIVSSQPYLEGSVLKIK